MPSSSSQVYLATLQEYLNGEEWKQSIQMFVRANSSLFRDVQTEYTHEHYEIWKTFQEIVEQILEMALSNVGGSMQVLEKALDEVASSPARGPRDAVVKNILDTLLSFDSFPAFSKMMHDAATNDECNDDEQLNRVNNNRNSSSNQSYSSSSSSLSTQSSRQRINHNYDNLIALGFPPDLISIVIEGASPDAPLEQLVMVLSELQSSSFPSSSSSSSSSSSHPNQLLQREGLPQREREEEKRSNRFSSQFPQLEKFAEEVGEDILEFHAKFVAARSVLDTYNEGHVNDDIVTLLQWASNMMELYSDIEIAYQEEIPFNDMKSNYTDGLLKWYKNLEETRREIDAHEIAGNLLSDNEMKRMAELDSIAALGTEDERLLHSLISRNDHVSKEINVLHQRCSLLVSSDNGIKRECLEELYLYLKEKVASGIDLASITDEMHEQVYSLVSSSKGADVINLLLDMHILEDEHQLLRLQINSLLGSPTRDDGSKYSDSKLSPSSPKFSMNGEKDLNLFGEDEISNTLSISLFRADEKSSSRDDIISGSKFDDIAENIGRGRGSDAGAKAWDLPDDHGSQFLDDLKSRHKKALHNLRDSLDLEKARRIKDLESRLKQRKKENSEGKDGDEDNVQQIIDKIASTTLKFDELKDGIISGFKKKCVYEIKASKSKGRVLSEIEKNECYRDAADSLKQRFERDNKSLQESLEIERMKQKSKILKELAKRKLRVTDENELILLEEQAKLDLEALHKNFDHHEVDALAAPHSNILLALASIFMDDNIINIDSPNKRNNSQFDDDDEAYLDEVHDSTNIQRTKKWIEGIESVKDHYISAAQQLQLKMRSALRGSDNQDMCFDDEEIDSDIKEKAPAFQEIYSHMSKVMVEAYSANLQDNIVGAGKFTDICDSDRIKDRILEEFERTRSDYDDALHRAKLLSQAKLADKRRQKGERNSDEKNETNNDDADILNSVLESFISNPTEISIPVTISPQKSISQWNNNANKLPLLPKSKAGVVLPSLGGGMDFPGKLNKRKVLGHSNAENSTEYEEFERGQILSRHEEKEKKLIEDLQSQMLQKKRQLEERLHKKREERSRAFDQTTRQKDILDFALENVDEDADKVQEDLDNLQSAFENVVSLVRDAKPYQLGDVNMFSLTKAMESIMQGEVIESLADVATSTSYANSNYQKDNVEKVQMQEEVRRISSVYNEEKQKLDLMMKLQQTRQRQALQRKLLERQSKQGPISESSSFASPLAKTPSQLATWQPSDRISTVDEIYNSPDTSSLQRRGLSLTPMMNFKK